VTGDRVFLDTVFVQALLNKDDQYHPQAKRLFPRVRAAREVWLTTAVLLEVGNALSGIDRGAAATFIRRCFETPNMHVAEVDQPLLVRGLQLFEHRPDKTWSLTDCISFTVMDDLGILDAATADQHFVQAGYRALLAEPGQV